MDNFFKMLEIKQTNEQHIDILVLVSPLGEAIAVPVLSSISIFIQKQRCTFGQCVIPQTPYNPGVFYIFRKTVLAARRGMCSTLTYHPNFNLPTTSLNPPYPPPKIPKNHSRITSTHLRKVLYFQQLSAP